MHTCTASSPKVDVFLLFKYRNKSQTAPVLVYKWQCHRVLADADQKENDNASALVHFHEALNISVRLKDKTKEATTLRSLASVSNYNYVLCARVYMLFIGVSQVVRV